MKKGAMELAITEAEKSMQNHKHGAVIVQAGKIISSGHNKTTSKVPSHLWSRHAEMAAIRQLTDKSKSLNDAQVYVVRINKCGLADSKPCKYCQEYMRLHGIKRVFYSSGVNLFDSMYI
uniref:CMP/dCMP-type deaminase domain-containing protein n=1 Tax=viral metagenome TaxID=1070528 RepID=A0A6C0FDI6_9ZZZZ|tara:strand:+ start:1808 stop:2164 length:357 start_codon:yes stop_codon:yes gene_type:complete